MLNIFRKNKPESAAFDWQETPTGIRFRAPSGELSPIQYADTLPREAYQAQAQWLLLKELLDNGQAELSDMGVHIPFEDVCCLNLREQELLGLPDPYPFEIEIQSDGTLNQPEFRYNYQFLKPDGKPLYPARIGCVLRLTEEWAYLLTHDQFMLLEELDAFNARDTADKNFQINLIEFAKIKGLTQNTGTTLDLYLKPRGSRCTQNRSVTST